MSEHRPTPLLVLKNSRTSAYPLRECSMHKGLSNQEGGVDLTPTRWVCGHCFKKLSMRKPR